MELLPILGNLFGANFLPDLEIRSSQNITVTVFESKKKKPFFFFTSLQFVLILQCFLKYLLHVIFV